MRCRVAPLSRLLPVTHAIYSSPVTTPSAKGAGPMLNILVTGSSTGIGRATALALARAGHQVIASMRRPESAGDLADVARQEKLALTIVALDVTSDASVADAFSAAERQHGAIDVLVNNAGIGQTGAVEDVAIDDFRRVMETNF